MGWVGYDKKPKIPYFVIQLFAKHFGQNIVESSIESPFFHVPPLGVMKAEQNVAELTSVASLDETGKSLFVNIVSRSWDTEYNVKINTGSFEALDYAVAWIISTPSVTDHNGKDIAPDIPEHVYKEPKLSSAKTRFFEIEKHIVNSKDPITIPPHSIITIEFKEK